MARAKKIRHFTEEEIKIIKETPSNLIQDTAFVLKRTVASVKSKKWALEHKKESNAIKNKYRKKRYENAPIDRKGQYNPWTKQEEELIMTSTLSDRELSEQMNRTEGSIQVKRARLLADERKKKNGRKRK